MYPAYLAIGWPGPFELSIIAGVALLIFGRRLPDVARSVGKSIVEFKRGLRDVKNDMDTSAQLESTSPPTLDNSPPKAPPQPEESADAGTAPDEDKA